MLSRSGVSIRRLISPRRVQDEFEDGVSVDTERWDQRTGRNDSNILPKRRATYSKRRPPPPIIVSREQSIHDILDPLPPLPPYDTPPRSRSSSLNSCERHNDSYLSHSIDSKRSKSPLCSLSSKEDRSQESLQLSSVTSYGGDDFPPPPPPKSYSESPDSLRRQAELSSSNLDYIESLSLRPENRAATLQQNLRRQESFSSITDNIQQLIQEADEAFRAVGHALVEVQVTNNSTKALPSLPTPESSPVLKPEPLASQTRVESPRPQTVASPKTIASPKTVISPKPAAAPVYSPRRNPSVNNGVKRKKSKKSKKVKPMKPSRKPAASKSTAKSGPIWNFSDNVTDLFSGKLFQKIEVDEMLTPDQLEEYRLRRMSTMQSEKSAKATQPTQSTQSTQPEKLIETIDAESTDTPIEPFHLEDLSSRIRSASVSLDLDTPTEEKHMLLPSNPVAWRDFSTEGRNEYGPIELPASISTSELHTDIGEEPAQNKNATFQTPPMRQAARFAARSQKASLPSIPETAAILTPTNELFVGHDLRYSRDMVADSNYVFLQSSPCSMTSPIFRHGPIRLAKSDLMADVKIGADDGLDWTAFQMAISGGAGDWFSESDDTIRRREAEEAAEIIEWFGSWNFSSPGGLLDHPIEADSPMSMTSGEDCSEVSYNETEKDSNPYNQHYHWQTPGQKTVPEFHQPDYDISGLELDTSRMSLDDEMFDESKEYNSRESYASLPQSPMLDLRVIRSSDGDDMDVVPMGYNLGHDLGDFLKWEAEHAYAGDFY
ncbi:hypothetical protein F5Y00DRAFT_55882 [Daldinia vernicosa]|uniref:uncharacterized protein n=1 Tax=Daldinia vernicosa TaxID=114800 RepID=UPI002008D368|nr:uncharacterized protein F5Y00DRAFT_55882 [Daldinia vernicosa]KAI0849654.1 hypothetical protein F5Y00DRAFT_55882 [Daldinia vernicosa]